MFSWGSIKKFVLINTPITLLGLGKYFFSDTLLNIFIGESATNLILVNLLNVDKPLIHGSERIIPTEEFPYEFLLYGIMTSFVKACTHLYVIDGLSNDAVDMYGVALFILHSLAFEIVFDGCHYITHRAAHSNRYLYRLHKTHHKFIHPSAKTTSYIHPVDLVWSYSLPLIIATKVVNLNMWEFWLITVYLTYQEIGGHIGKELYPTSSFAQCIWLPRALGIELYTEDHDLHHSKFKWNYGKRFSLWDKVFGTYMRSGGSLST